MKQLIVLLLLVSAAVAQSHPVETHQMYNDCKTALKPLDASVAIDAMPTRYCLGYLHGFADRIGQHVSNGVFDIKSNVSTEALARSFVNYVTAHPGEMDSPYMNVVIMTAWRRDNILIAKPVKQ